MEQPELDKVESEIKEQLGGNVHVIRERPGSCVMCGSNEDLRFGWCWDCATAQEIISSGKDMYENGEGGTELPIKETNARLKMLLEKGWHRGK